MARPLSKAVVPPWFDVARYGESYGMDAADWYLNLSLRAAVARGKCVLGRQYVRGSNPIVLRGDEESATAETSVGRKKRQWPPAAEVLDFIRSVLGDDFAAILDGKEPRRGVENLRAEELYFFERRLPETIRQFGRRYVPGKTPASEAPPGFSGPVDHLFKPRFLSVFVRLDLSRPDEALHDDLDAFLARERRALAAIGGEQPFAAELRELGNCNRANLKTFANVGVLPYLDVEQWRSDEGTKFTDAAFARALGITADDLREARKKARLVLDDFVLRGWLLDAACSAARKPRP